MNIEKAAEAIGERTPIDRSSDHSLWGGKVNAPLDIWGDLPSAYADMMNAAITAQAKEGNMTYIAFSSSTPIAWTTEDERLGDWYMPMLTYSEEVTKYQKLLDYEIHSYWYENQCVPVTESLAPCEEDDCEAVIDTDMDSYHYVQEERLICDSCWTSYMESASVVYSVSEDGVERYYSTAIGMFDEWYEETDDLFGQSENWRSSDAWRGHMHSTPDPEVWTEVLDGWTTGSWGDAISDGKKTFNEWAAELIDGKAKPPCHLLVIVSVTSNVFSTAVGVWAKKEDADKVLEMENFDDLYSSLG